MDAPAPGHSETDAPKRRSKRMVTLLLVAGVGLMLIGGLGRWFFLEPMGIALLVAAWMESNRYSRRRSHAASTSGRITRVQTS